MLRFDLIVIGAGIVGLATALTASELHPGWRIAVIDKEQGPGRHQTGHNSGVIHTGIYYRTGSNKARLCVQGAAALHKYCLAKHIPVEQCGKVIVATDEDELPRLDRLYAQGVANGVVGLEIVDATRLRQLEPQCRGIRAIWSPTTGIVDYSVVVTTMADDFRSRGGELLFGWGVRGVRESSESVTLLTGQGELETRRAVSCTGLQADRVARMCGQNTDLQIIPFRGDYWQLNDRARGHCRNLIYPVPDPRFPFLGIHATRRIDSGEVWVGPNAVVALAREGYRRTDFDLKDTLEVMGSAGFRKLASRHAWVGSVELWRDLSKRAFWRAVRRYLPDVRLDDLIAGPSGVRAQPVGRGGELIDDFVIKSDHPRLAHVLSAPSPAATSSLAIARTVVDAIADL